MVSLRRQGSNQVPQEKSYFTFVGGLNTDASPVNFPENFSSDEENFVLNLDGSRQRRLGLSLEEGGEVIAQTEVIYENSSVEVQDLGLDTRGFTITYDSRDYLFTYDPAAEDLVLSFTTTSTKDTVPFSEVEIDGVTYKTVDATYNRTLVGSVFVNTYTWADVTSFPTVSTVISVDASSGAVPNEGIVRAHHWRNVAGDPTLNMLVLQVGARLQLYWDTEVISQDGGPAATIELDSHRVEGSDATTEDVETSPINTDYGRGHLFVVGEHIKPFYVEWDKDAEEFVEHDIRMLERDFEGIEDGLDNYAQPTSDYADVTSHEYNLKNKGWRSAMISQFISDDPANRYPAKNMIPSYFLQRGGTSTDTINALDAVKAFSYDRLVSQLFQDVPAPSGHFIRDIFDTTIVTTSDPTTTTPSGDTFSISDVQVNSELTTMQLIFNEDPGVAVYDDVFVKGIKLQMRTYKNTIVILEACGTAGAVYEVQGISNNGVDEWYVNVGFTNFWGYYSEWLDTLEAGTMQTSYIDNSPENGGSGYISYVRPRAVAFYAGRVWYAGTNHPKLSHKVYFSQIVESDAQYGKCFQVADPTSEDISDLIATDGGYIQIPEVDVVHELLVYNGRLLVFADNGIWEISGGSEYGYFKATDYSVRQIANTGAVNAQSIVIADGTPFFWGEGSIYTIQQDPDRGFLFVQDISTGRLQKFVSNLSKAAKAQIQAAYDRNEKKIYWLYDGESGETWQYANWLVYDLRINAFSKFRNCNSDFAVRAIYDIEEYQSYDSAYKNIKFFVYDELRTWLFVCELNNEEFKDSFTYDPYGVGDYTSSEDAAAYVVTNYENFGAPSRMRYGKYLFTYLKRTETGYTANGDEWDPVNPGSCKVRFLWNWADTSNTGKWSSQYQAYKYPRVWIPADETDLYGESVLVSKLKIRGTGRVLQLRYDTEAEKDCHIYGWHMRNEINREA